MLIMCKYVNDEAVCCWKKIDAGSWWETSNLIAVALLLFEKLICIKNIFTIKKVRATITAMKGLVSKNDSSV